MMKNLLLAPVQDDVADAIENGECIYCPLFNLDCSIVDGKDIGCHAALLHFFNEEKKQ